MFLVAHVGFAAAPASALARWWSENRGFSSDAPDMRWLLAGTILPDLVDKAVGQVFLRPYFENGRIFCHTAVFALLVMVAGICRMQRRRDSRLFLLACGVASHFVLDRMWLEPTTALWPSLGPFLRDPSQQSLLEQIMESLRSPAFWAAECGGALLLLLSLRLLGIRSLGEAGSFLRRGSSPSLVPLGMGG